MPVKLTTRPTSPVTQQATAAQLFEEAVSLKRSGDLDGALTLLDRAVAQAPQDRPLLMARAGYTALAGDVNRAKQLLLEVPLPPETAPGEPNPDRIDYSINLAWFSAIAGDDAAVAGHLRDAIQLGGGEVARPYVEGFVASEPDLARLRDTPAVLAALKAPATRDAPDAAAVVGTANPTERESTTDFVANQGQPARGASLLNTRIDAMKTKRATSSRAAQALAPLATMLPGATETAHTPVGALLATKIEQQLRAALAAGHDSVALDTGDLRDLLEQGFKSGSKGADQITKALSSLGYKASHSAFANSLWVGFADDAPPAPAPKKGELLDALRALEVPAPAAATSPAESVATLVRAKIEAAKLDGESRVLLEPAELGRALGDLGRGAKAYVVLEELLQGLGYRASSDGFVGVSLSWANQAVDGLPAAQVRKDFAARMPTADALRASQASDLADLVRQKIGAARLEGESRVSLEPAELDPLLRPARVKYDDVAKALEDAGFKADADGFVGVWFRWG